MIQMETAMLVVEAGASNPSLVTYSQPGAHSASRCVGRRYVCLRPSPFIRAHPLLPYSYRKAFTGLLSAALID